MNHASWHVGNWARIFLFAPSPGAVHMSLSDSSFRLRQHVADNYPNITCVAASNHPSRPPAAHLSSRSICCRHLHDHLLRFPARGRLACGPSAYRFGYRRLIDVIIAADFGEPHRANDFGSFLYRYLPPIGGFLCPPPEVCYHHLKALDLPIPSIPSSASRTACSLLISAACSSM